MNLNDSKISLFDEDFLWLGLVNSESLARVRQANASAVFTSLHQIPDGDCWPSSIIRERKAIIEVDSLRWTALKSVIVHNDIEIGRGESDGAERDHTAMQCEFAHVEWIKSDAAAARNAFINSISDVFPGIKRAFALDDVHTVRTQYENIKESELHVNFARFLRVIILVRMTWWFILRFVPMTRHFPCSVCHASFQ